MRCGAELAAVRARGFAVSHGELEPALWGVSAAALDRRAGPPPCSACGARSRACGERLDELGALAAGAAGALAARLN